MTTVDDVRRCAQAVLLDEDEEGVQVWRAGDQVVFRLLRSKEEFRLSTYEARRLGAMLLNAAWMIDDHQRAFEQGTK